MTQNEKIIRHFDDHKKINPMQALREYGIMRLASRISDLRRKGYKFTKVMKKHVNKYGEVTHYAEYRMVKE